MQALPPFALCCLAAMACASLPARAAVDATVAGHTGTEFARRIETPVVQTTTFQPQGGKLVTFEGVSTDFDPSGAVISLSRSEGLAFADHGLLRARLDTSAYAAINPVNPSIAGIWGAQAVATVRAAFSDGLTITSGTLAVGTVIRYLATFSMDFVSNGPANGTGSFGYTATVGEYELGLHLPNDARGTLPGAWETWRRVPVELEGRVGDRVPVFSTLQISGSATTGLYGSGGHHGDGFERTFIDASNTARLFVDALTPNVAFRSDSGHDYASVSVPVQPIPEPETWALLAAGLGVLGWRGRCSGGSRRRATTPPDELGVVRPAR